MHFLVALFSLFPLASLAGDAKVFARGDSRFASDPVPVMDWSDGWQDGYRRGRYAYANVEQSIGFGYSGWQVEYGRRSFLDATFSPDTAEFYYRLEHDEEISRTYDIELEVAAFSGNGISLGYEFTLSPGLRITPEISHYVLSDYQFGEFSGSSDGDQALLLVDYYFSEDKILEYPTDGSGGSDWSADVKDGYFTTFDLQLSWVNDLIALHVVGEDLLNTVRLPVTARTYGCVLFRHEANSSCPGGGGYSTETSYKGRIQSSLSADVTHIHSGVQLSAFRHGLYQRFGLSKLFETRVGTFSTTVYSTRQLGLAWRNPYVSFNVAADAYDAGSIRYLDFSLLLQLQW